MAEYMANGKDVPQTNKHYLNNADDTDKDYIHALKDGIAWLNSDTSLSDITLVVEGEKFPCHRSVLGMFSHYFRAMFACSLKEKNQHEIQLHSICAKTIKRVLRFIYTGDTEWEDIEDLFLMSIYLQIEILIKVCQKKLCAFLDHKNILNLWRLSKLNVPQCNLLYQACKSWLLSSFTANFGKSDEMLELEKDELVQLLSSDLLFAPNEEVVCRNVMRWCDGDALSRNKHLKELFEYIRLPLVKSKFLQTFTESLTPEQREFLNPYVLEAENFLQNPARQCDYTSFRTEHRAASFSEKVLVTIADDQIWFYSFQKRKWGKLPSIPVKFNHGFATCTYGQSDLYVSGGFNSYICYKLHGRDIQCNWYKCPGMLDVRWDHSMISVDNSIYVLGGNGRNSERPLKSIEKYNPGRETWTDSGQLLIPVSNVATAAVRHKIYLFGGESPDGKQQTVQCFCTITNTTSKIMISELPCSRNVYSVGFDDEIYLLTSDKDRNLIFSFHEDSVKEVASFFRGSKVVHSANKTSYSGIYKRGSKITLLGGIHPVKEGENGHKVYKISKKIIEIDLKSNIYKEQEETLPHSPQGIRCHVITVSKSHLHFK